MRADFDGEFVSSEGGVLLLDAVERRSRVCERLAACFRDHRDPRRVEHSVLDLVRQRLFGLALGYEDLNDHDQLRRDPLLAACVGKRDPRGDTRARARDLGAALAASSTLNRLELSTPDEAASHRYKRIALDPEAADALLVDLFLDSYEEPPERITIDLDATDDPLHGRQEGRFFHGYYGHYCYMPLYIFCGDQPLLARLRRSNIDGSAGSKQELARIVAQIQKRWPTVKILIRGDSGFCREELMAWCEATQGVDFLFGLARNARLEARIAKQLHQAKQAFRRSGEASRCFTEFYYATKKTWSRPRRVIAKAEHLRKGQNPRFVVTSLINADCGTREVYEQLYCARGDMENRIKEQQLFLFADRTSTQTMRANQLRLYLSTFAYALLEHLRRIGLRGTSMRKSQCDPCACGS